MIAAIVMTRPGSGWPLVYLVWLAFAVGIVLIGPWPRPVTRFRRCLSALVVAVLLAGSLVASVKHSALYENPCSMWGGGWWTTLCEWIA